MHSGVLGTDAASYLAVWETMEEAALLYVLHVEDDVSVAASAGRRDDVLVERERDENNDDEEVNNRADAAHAFRDLLLVVLAHVDAFQPGFHERWAQPSYHGVSGTEGNATKGNRSNKGFPIALEGVGKDCNTSGGKRKETEGLGSRQSGRRSHRGLAVLEWVETVGCRPREVSWRPGAYLDGLRRL